jgi:sec-independent protein translocase protein TatC
MEEPRLPEVLHLAKKRARHFALLAILGFSALWFVADRIIARMKADLLPEEAKLIVTSPMEYVMVKVQITLILAVLLALPPFLFYVSRRAGFRIKKRLSFLVWTSCAAGLFAAGFAFTYLFLLPVAIKVLTGLTTEAEINPYFSVNQFILFAAVTTLLFSLVFELPLLVSWLSINGYVSVETLKEKRRHVYVAIVIVAAIITADPTPVSQVLLSLPLVFLYEISILSARIFGKS